MLCWVLYLINRAALKSKLWHFGFSLHTSCSHWTIFCLKTVSTVQPNSIQPQWTFHFEGSPCAALRNITVLSAPSSERLSISPLTPVARVKRGGLVPLSTYTLSHPVWLCWCWGSPARCVSVPLGEAAMQMHGDENTKLLWSKHLLCYSSSVVASAHMSPYGTCASCQSPLWYRWMHFPYQVGLKQQVLLAQCVPATIKLHLVCLSSWHKEDWTITHVTISIQKPSPGETLTKTTFLRAHASLKGLFYYRCRPKA